MANMPLANALNAMDALARMWEIMAPVLGDDEVTPDTWRRGVKLVWDEALIAADETEAQSPLTNVATPADAARLSMAPAVHIRDAVQGIMTGLQSELDNDIAAYLSEEGGRCHYLFGDLYYYVSGARLSPTSVVFPPVQTIGSMARAGGSWTYTPGTAVDTTKHGPARLEIVCLGAVGLQDIVVTLTLAKFDGGTEQRQVTVTGQSEEGATFAVSGESDLYVNVASAEVSGGTDGDSLGVRTILARSIEDILS